MLAEMVNTALEFLSDAVTLSQNEFIKHAKDAPQVPSCSLPFLQS